MQAIFDQHRVSYMTMCNDPAGVINSEDLVVQIEQNFYPWHQAAPMIMAFLTFKQPLPPDQVGSSLNEIMLPCGQ